MSAWGEVFLGVIAVATLSTALVQIAVLVAAAKLASRLDHLADSVEAQLTPIFAQLNVIGREASRATSLASAQVERVDALLGDVVSRIDQTMGTVQSALSIPAREGAALVAGFRAIVETLRGGRRPKSRSRGEDEDALFI